MFQDMYAKELSISQNSIRIKRCEQGVQFPGDVWTDLPAPAKNVVRPPHLHVLQQVWTLALKSPHQDGGGGVGGGNSSALL